jgi:hypothetical protein
VQEVTHHFQKLQMGFGNKFVPFRTNCLNLRRRRVGFDGFKSGAFVASWGVPQESNLGPLLFRHLQLDGQKLYNFLLTCVFQNFSQNTICPTNLFDSEQINFSYTGCF